MNISDFKAGTFKKGYQYSYFVPEKINHTFVWTDDLINELLEKASLLVGELNSFSRFVPDTDMFIKMHTYKEAVESSKIEGTRTKIEEALNEEKDIDPEKRDDWQEVNNYVEAMNKAIEELAILPLSNRLILNAHRILLSSVRGEHKNPGEFRRSQNWIGGANLATASYIPPKETELPELMSDFEKFLNNKEIKIPHLIRIAIAHYQFETIHPFLDGNGRIGRLLITLYLLSNGILEKPLLYLSDFFERNRSPYYDHLNIVHTKDDLGSWIKFFLTGVIQTSENALKTLKEIYELKKLMEQEKIISMGKRSKHGTILLNALFQQPVVSSKEVQSITGLSPKASNNLLQVFVDHHILKEKTGYLRNRIFIFDSYIKMFK
jgi:Fic family protein